MTQEVLLSESIPFLALEEKKTQFLRNCRQKCIDSIDFYYDEILQNSNYYKKQKLRMEHEYRPKCFHTIFISSVLSSKERKIKKLFLFIWNRPDFYIEGVYFINDCLILFFQFTIFLFKVLSSFR